MKNNKYWIPSALTLINLSLGFLAILLNDPFYSLILIFIALFFDLFDGIVARAIHAQSEFGKQLDSLSDVVSFGVAPAFLIYHHCFLIDSNLRFVVVLIPIFSAIRLAKFNIDSTQKTNFKGLPTPANGLFFASIPYASNSLNIFHPDFIMAILIAVFSLLLIAPIRMFAFKNIKNGGADMVFPIVFASIVAISLPVFGLEIIPLCIVLYLFMSLIYSLLIFYNNSKYHSR